jgi:hypothetical protein
MGCFHDHPDGVVLSIKVQPRASKTMIAGIQGDTLKVKLTAPPVEGEANKQCLQFLAKLIGVPKSNLEILSGGGSRHKQVLVRPKPGRPDKKAMDELKAKLRSLAGSKDR